MAETVADLEKQLADLRRNRNGVLRVRIGEEETTFSPDADLAAAIADLERRINAVRHGRITTIRLSSSKGF